MYPNWNFKTNVPELEFGTNSPEVLYSERQIHGVITNLGQGKKVNKISFKLKIVVYHKSQFYVPQTVNT